MEVEAKQEVTLLPSVASLIIKQPPATSATMSIALPVANVSLSIQLSLVATTMPMLINMDDIASILHNVDVFKNYKEPSKNIRLSSAWGFHGLQPWPPPQLEDELFHGKEENDMGAEKH